MNIFNKITLESMKKSRTRTLVTIIGVVLSAAMITAVATFGVSLLDYMTRGAAQKYGDWQVAFSEVSPAFAERQAQNEGVAATAYFEDIGYATLEGSENSDKPYVFIAGFNAKTFDTLPLTLLSGRLPENSEELLVSGSVTTNGGVEMHVGDTLSLAVGKRMAGNDALDQNVPYSAGAETLVPETVKTYRVVGICGRPSFEGDEAPGYTLITASDIGGTAPRSVFVSLENPREAQAYASQTAEGHRYSFNDKVLRFMGLSEDKVFTAMLYAVGAIVVAIIMIGSVFLIYNAFNIALNERMHQFGILASVGATPRQLCYSVLFEGLCIGVIGIPLGILVGIGSIALVMDIVAKNFGDILYTGVPLTLSLSLPAILLAAVVSMVTILISAYLPARKAANTPVMACIRQTNAVKVAENAVKISRLAQRVYGLEGTLARKNFKRNKKRYRSIVLSLVLSILLLVSASAFVTDLEQASAQAKVVTDYDIGFGTEAMEEGELLSLYEKLKGAAGVYESGYQVCQFYTAVAEPSMLSQAYRESAGEGTSLGTQIQFLDDSSYQKLVVTLGLSPEEYTGQGAKVLAVAKMESNSAEINSVEDLPDIFTQSDLALTVIPEKEGVPLMEQGKDLGVTCVEMVPPDTPPARGSVQQQPYFFRIIAPYSLKATLASGEVAIEGLTFQSENPEESTAEIQKIIEGEGITAGYTLFNSHQTFDESRNIIFITNVFATTFILMISLIAVANVFNTISTNIRLRRRELAMLRSVGMSDGDFNKMMCFECAFYGMQALFIGIPLSAIASFLIYKGMFLAGAEGIRFALPWASMGISVLGVFVVIGITMCYAVSQIKKENIIDALRDDMA